MKNNFLICLFLCLSVIFGCIGPAFASDSDADTPAAVQDMSVTNGCATADGQVPVLGAGKLLDTAGAAFLFEVNSGTVMYAWNPDVPMEPASLVKIMTALLAVEQGELSAVVKVRQEALQALPDGSSTTKLAAGEEISLSDLLYCLLVGSSNDAAVVIADHIAGSQEAFVAQMNAKGEALGFRGTLFTNAHGLPDELQVTTARDMAKLLAYATTIDAFMPFFAAVEYTVGATNLSEERELSSTNYMMMPDKATYYDPRVIGGRTGITSNRDRCLAVAAQSDSLTYVGVILSAVPVFKEDGFTVKRFGSYEEMEQLLGMAFDGYRLVQVLNQEQILMQCNVTGGANCVAAMPDRSVSVVLPSGTNMDMLTLQYQQNIHELNAPVEAGQTLTQLQIWNNNVCLAQTGVVAGNASLESRQLILPHSVQSNAGVWKTLLVIVCVLALIVAILTGVLFGIRYYKKFLFQAQQRRRRRDRRRSK